MTVEVTVRHLELSEWERNYAREKAETLGADFPRVEHVHVILDGQKRERVAEIVVQGKNHIRIEGKDSADDTRTAIDRCYDKVDRQLRKRRDRVQDHKGGTDLASFERAQQTD